MPRRFLSFALIVLLLISIGVVAPFNENKAYFCCHSTLDNDMQCQSHGKAQHACSADICATCITAASLLPYTSAVVKSPVARIDFETTPFNFFLLADRKDEPPRYAVL